MTRKLHHETNPRNARRLVQRHGDRLLVINPPGYQVYAERKAIAVPAGNVQTLLEVAAKYQANYLLL
mgnify:CR=1 FL=1